MKKPSLLGLIFLLSLSSQNIQAQFKIDGQIIQRAEFRNGFGRLIPDDQDPFSFIAHRARLQATYEMEKFTFYMSVQDVRVWGSTAQLKSTDSFLSVHEAWALAGISDNWKIKLGRQELNYDNFRFLGNQDWELQGRAHDLVLLMHEKEDMKLHFGGAYNQSKAALFESPFDTPNQYKLAQMVRYENKWGKFRFSTLFWNDGREFNRFNSDGVLIQKGNYYRQTLGIPTLQYNSGNSQFSAYHYQQFGKDPVGKKVNAHNFSLAFNQTFPIDSEKRKSWTLSAGYEQLSGTASNEFQENRSFNPLYGTNHLFNGYMDLFYREETLDESVGLRDIFLRSRLAFSDKFFLQGDLHAFFAHNKVLRIDVSGDLQRMDDFLGTQLDFSLGYVVNDVFSIQSGYSQFFKTDTFSFVQSAPNPKNNQNWAYLMLIFRPSLKDKFIGIQL
ncbi:hypothetical protein P872_18865 [Rhodonellum psychrophilum GCM71 = DSM 17998]|uniref:Alginate export domain-containing protein n=2 Tax=Rhodonellum TaxID=336827 RepID=U5BZZ4_9BACT|nr:MULTISPECIES: hypothetical protein [Rhodonellum]ERM82246.1 hypothetical protein P872_18865 [Rhodonellum psychrophilum GCM71 = DSM 17998]SDZ25905.1 hypothetical protein SAMN05444412_108164 [Rhodonellum ikkaensis]